MLRTPGKRLVHAALIATALGGLESIGSAQSARRGRPSRSTRPGLGRRSSESGRSTATTRSTTPRRPAAKRCSATLAKMHARAGSHAHATSCSTRATARLRSKWGSTNAYTEDAPETRSTAGRCSTASWTPSPARARSRYAEIAFMPQAISRRAADALQELRRVRARRRQLLPAQRLREVGRAHRCLGQPRQGSLPECREHLAMGAVERAGHRLLARHARRVRQDVRLHRGGAAPSAAQRASRWSIGGERGEQLSQAVPRALRDRNQRSHAARSERVSIWSAFTPRAAW